MLAGGPLEDSLDNVGFYGVQGAVSEDCLVSFSDWFTNDADEPVLITAAEFQSVKGVTVAGIMKLPKGVRGVGNIAGFPTPRLKKHWAQTRELVGSTLRPGERVTLVIGLRLNGGERQGAVRDLAIEYEVDGRRYRATDNDRFRAVSWPKEFCET